MNNITNPAFWRSIGWALIRTLIAVVVPFIGPMVNDPANGWRPAVAAAVPAMIVAVATMLKGSVDPATTSFGMLLLSRGLRQLGQFAAGVFVADIVFWSFDWQQFAVQALVSVLTTLALAALTLLPEETAPTGPAVLMVAQPEQDEL